MKLKAVAVCVLVLAAIGGLLTACDPPPPVSIYPGATFSTIPAWLAQECLVQGLDSAGCNDLAAFYGFVVTN